MFGARELLIGERNQRTEVGEQKKQAAIGSLRSEVAALDQQYERLHRLKPVLLDREGELDGLQL